MLKRGLRRFIVWSSRPPFLSLYRMIYRLIIRIAVFILSRHSDVISIYVCRGCAKNEIVPGISDIDLAIFVEDDSPQIESIRDSFARLSRATGKIIDFYPNLVNTRSQLEQDWNSAPLWQYKYIEGKANWMLVYGQHLLDSLSPLSLAQQRSSCVAEMNRWWVVFAQLLLNTSTYHEDDVMRNATCYKCITELANAQHAVRRGECRYSRAAALDDLEPALAATLASLSEKRFLVPDDGLMDETLRFLLRSYRKMWSEFGGNPFLYIYDRLAQRVDDADLQLNPAEEMYLQSLTEYVASRSQFHRKTLYTVRSAFWDLEDLLVLLDLDENTLPSVRDLAGLTANHHKIRSAYSCKAYLFLRMDSIAFPITPEVPRDLHRGVATPATIPDVFLQLGESQVYWTDYAQWYLCDWRTNRQWVNASVNKRLQLDIIAKSANEGSVIYPLTTAALERHSASAVLIDER